MSPGWGGGGGREACSRRYGYERLVRRRASAWTEALSAAARWSKLPGGAGPPAATTPAHDGRRRRQTPDARRQTPRTTHDRLPHAWGTVAAIVHVAEGSAERCEKQRRCEQHRSGADRGSSTAAGAVSSTAAGAVSSTAAALAEASTTRAAVRRGQRAAARRRTAAGREKCRASSSKVRAAPRTAHPPPSRRSPPSPPPRGAGASTLTRARCRSRPFSPRERRAHGDAQVVCGKTPKYVTAFVPACGSCACGSLADAALGVSPSAAAARMHSG